VLVVLNRVARKITLRGVAITRKDRRLNLRLISYSHGGESGVGVMVDDDGFVALAKAAPELPRSLRGIVELGDDALAKAKAAAAGRSADHHLGDVIVDPLIPEPPAIWCVGVNYAAHREETGRMPSDEPTMFMRIGASQVGHGQAMVVPKASSMLDYEGELAVIIGTGGRHIPRSEAMNHIAGYSCYNDGSVRDWQRHTSQFGPGKNFHRTGGFGPWLLTADELPNPYEQTLVTRVSGEELQRTTIDLMLFRIDELIEYLSTMYPLNPGDVISTGTPAGVGWKREPQRFLVAGDVVEVEISGVGTLSNPVVAES
jgi:2-keto-4-pentenoate hydratase/2-oxohepta-3-ene-1,7-dioic acid hydratase in catechol pathway